MICLHVVFVMFLYLYYLYMSHRNISTKTPDPVRLIPEPKLFKTKHIVNKNNFRMHFSLINNLILQICNEGFNGFNIV